MKSFFINVMYPLTIIVLMVLSLRVLSYFERKTAYESGYLNACKDCYKGQLKYELKDNPDGSRIWIKIK